MSDSLNILDNWIQPYPHFRLVIRVVPATVLRVL